MMKEEKFSVLKENMEGGWTKVKNGIGKKGKVPTLFLKIDTAKTSAPLAPSSAPQAPSPPSSAPQAPSQPATASFIPTTDQLKKAKENLKKNKENENKKEGGKTLRDVLSVALKEMRTEIM